jgi:hypothetical protein
LGRGKWSGSLSRRRGGDWCAERRKGKALFIGREVAEGVRQVIIVDASTGNERRGR